MHEPRDDRAGKRDAYAGDQPVGRRVVVLLGMRAKNDRVHDAGKGNVSGKRAGREEVRAEDRDP
jgi:hypothetical protein